MLRSLYATFFVLVALAPSLSAAPPEVPRALRAEPGQLVRIVAKGEKVGSLKNFTDEEAFFDELVSKGTERRFVFQATRPGVYVVGFFTVGESEGVACTITVGGAPVPPPTPPVPPGPVPPVPPDPKPPAPEQVTSFRVFLIYESGKTLPIAQAGVLYGLPLETALNTATKGDGSKFAWRRIDKDADASTLPVGLREVWAVTKPQVTSVPAIALQVNDKITIEPLPSSQAEAVALVKKYRGEK